MALEDAPDLYATALAAELAPLKRVLKPKGTLWLNLGDTYDSAKSRRHGADGRQPGRRLRQLRPVDRSGGLSSGIPRKSLLGIPFRVALSLQADGWTWPSAITWERGITMGEPSAQAPLDRA